MLGFLPIAAAAIADQGSQGFSGSAVGTSDASATFTYVVPWDGSALGTSSTAGAFTYIIPAVCSAVGTSDASATFTYVVPWDGTSVGASTASWSTRRYLVATGDWNDTATWSSSDGGAGGASIPLAGDPVSATAASGSVTLTVNVASACGSFDATGFTGSVVFDYDLAVTSVGTVFAAGTTATWSGAGAINLTDSTASARTVGGGSASVALPKLKVSAGSGSLTTSTCNVNGFDCTGFTGNWENNAITSRGNITLPAGMTASAAVSGSTRITAAGTGVISIGFTFDRSIYVGTSAWTLGANLVIGSSRAFYVDSATGGSFDDAGFTITAGGAGAFGTGAASWTQRANYEMQTTGTAWSMPATMTFACISGRITYTNNSATGKTFAGGGKTYGELRYAPSSGTGALTITGANTFATLSDTGTAAHAWKFTAGTTTHVTTWSIQGTAGNLITVTSATAATHTLYANGGLNQADYLDISYSTAHPASLWQALSNCVDSGNNQGWFGGASQQAMWNTVRIIRNRQTARDEANGGATRKRKARARGGR